MDSHDLYDLLETARIKLSEAIWLAERLEYHALEGEIITVLAGLENVMGAVRRDPGARRKFGEMKHG